MTILTETEVGELQLDSVSKHRALVIASHENLRHLLTQAMKIVDILDKELYLIQGYELEEKLPPNCQLAHEFRMKLKKEGFVYEDTKVRGSVGDQGKPQSSDGE